MRGKGTRARTAGLILAGIAAGSLLGGPAVAHVGGNVRHLINKHLVNFFYTESEADGRFINSTEKASDADKLDGIDSASFLQGTSILPGVFSCPGTGFYPELSTTDYGALGDGERGVPPGHSGTLRCAVDLPNGATVTSVTFTLNDRPAGGTVSDCVLARTDLTVPVATEDTVSTPPAATADAGHVTVIGTIIAANAVVANSSFGYSLACDLGEGTGVFGAVVTYTVPASAG